MIAPTGSTNNLPPLTATKESSTATWQKLLNNVTDFVIIVCHQVIINTTGNNLLRKSHVCRSSIDQDVVIAIMQPMVRLAEVSKGTLVMPASVEVIVYC